MRFLNKVQIIADADYEAKTAEWSSALGLPLKYIPNLSHEADSRPTFVAIGPKFYLLPDDECRTAVLYHEYAHFKGLDMEALADNKLWELVDSGAFGKKRPKGTIDGINGAFTPGENIAEAYSVLLMEPTWLKSKYPLAYDYVLHLATKMGLPLKRWMK